MTAQIPEHLRFEDEDHSMFSEPLGDYFALTGQRPDFGCSCTALWRGYMGRWEITDGRLYLVAVQEGIEDDGPSLMERFFPGFPNRVFAHWYTGVLRVPQGRRLKYVHMGYGSTFERDLFLKVHRGELVGRAVKENGVADEGNPKAFGPAAFATFPTDEKLADGSRS